MSRKLIALCWFIFLGIAGFAQTQDSLQVAVPDSLYKGQLQQLDSIQLNTKREFGKLRHEYDSLDGQFGRSIASLRHQSDSLKSLNLPTDSYTKKIDSLTQLREGTLAGVRNKADMLKERSTQKINSLKLPLEVSKETQQFTQQLNKLNVGLPDASLKNFPTIPSLGNQTGVTLPGVNAPTLPNVSTPGINTSVPGTDIKTPEVLGDAKAITDQAKEISDKTKGVTEKIKTPSKEELAEEAKQEAEHKVKDAANDVAGKADLPRDNPLKDGQLSQDELKEQAKKEAVNHFAGKEQQVQQAMEQMSKLKQKYSSVQSIKDLPKKAPNPMKDKPFIERIVPGLQFQILLRNDWLTDFNPYLGYKFNGRITAGIGWNQRWAFTREKGFNSKARIYGPRVYGEFKLVKGFAARLDIETMYTHTPPILKKQPLTEQFKREWVPGIFVGLKKDYTIYKRLKGTATVLYNLYNPDYKSPYGDRLMTRFGFEYTFKKKKKEEERKNAK